MVGIEVIETGLETHHLFVEITGFEQATGVQGGDGPDVVLCHQVVRIGGCERNRTDAANGTNGGTCLNVIGVRLEVRMRMRMAQLDQFLQMALQAAESATIGFDQRPVAVALPEDHQRAWSCVDGRSEEHTSELQSQSNLVCRLLLEKK